MAASSKAWVCGRSLTGIAGSNPSKAWMFVSFECCVVSSRGLFVELVTPSWESYRVCVCVIERDSAQQSPSTPTVSR